MQEEKKEEKKIILQGTNNRYQMKKATKTGQEKDKKRKETEKWNISIEDYTYEKQMEVLKEMKNIQINQNNEKNESTKSIHQLVIQQIERKMSSYKHQDLEKKVYEPSKIVKYPDVLSFLLETKAKCFYCFSEMFILYEKVREGKQWTLDRINNDLGHNTDNVVLACLECNLKRRCHSKEGFLFTKQLKIVQREKDS
jgi:hypothetical protein